LVVTTCSLEDRVPVHQTTGCRVPSLPVTDRNNYRGYCHLGFENMWFGRGQVLGTYVPNCTMSHPRRLLFILITGRSSNLTCK